MIVVIIAGGSGTRLWPLSTPSYPKHLLTVNGEDESLVQKTYERASRVASEVFVITEEGHAHHVKNQLPDLVDENFIIEPARRGTASCIVAALVHLSSRIDPKEPIAFLAADHYIRDVDGFAHSFRIAGDISVSQNRLTLVGIEPEYAATGFGYIQKAGIADVKALVYSVQAFKEKPEFETAKQYVNSGNYLWNCGYFVGSIDTFVAAMRQYAPDLSKSHDRLLRAGEKYKDVYLSFDNISIDYALIEKVKDLLVVPASFDWMDLGSYGDLHKASDSDVNRNHTFGDVELEGVENSYIINRTNIPLAVIGLDNVAVIHTKDGVLITRKDLSQKVGEVSKRISARKG